ncbi:hypothetical protein [Pseudidiomarina sp.]|uniref:hypothetical protein n=1 Tax=Pseudidiomarina sp. TaxID=2081707 RepID=UPI003A988374
MIEILLMTIFVAAIWLIPVTSKQATVIEVFEQIAHSTSRHVAWIWMQFTLNPLVL